MMTVSHPTFYDIILSGALANAGHAHKRRLFPPGSALDMALVCALTAGPIIMENPSVFAEEGGPGRKESSREWILAGSVSSGGLEAYTRQEISRCGLVGQNPCKRGWTQVEVLCRNLYNVIFDGWHLLGEQANARIEDL